MVRSLDRWDDRGVVVRRRVLPVGALVPATSSASSQPGFLIRSKQKLHSSPSIKKAHGEWAMIVPLVVVRRVAKAAVALPVRDARINNQTPAAEHGSTVPSQASPQHS